MSSCHEEEKLSAVTRCHFTNESRSSSKKESRLKIFLRPPWKHLISTFSLIDTHNNLYRSTECFLLLLTLREIFSDFTIRIVINYNLWQWKNEDFRDVKISSWSFSNSFFLLIHSKSATFLIKKCYNSWRQKKCHIENKTQIWVIAKTFDWADVYQTLFVS